MDKSSLKSSNIECRFPHSVSRKGEFSNRAHAFMRGQFLPVPIFIGLHGIEARVAADSLVHWFVCSTSRAALQQYFRRLRWPVGMPLCRPMGKGLWEVRTDLRSNCTARVLICFYQDLLVGRHRFMKDTRARRRDR